ncbi:MAG: hypothetical protein MJ071_01020 [Oscillospiraceae bacterium]|nr:hypothetical protein [Oscillospiraceae bacterium]
MTNSEFFSACCSTQDLCAIDRYVRMDLEAYFEGKTLSEKEEILDKWLRQKMDPAKWDSANNPEHRIPHDMY